MQKKRFHCEFKNCYCRKFRFHCNKLCLHCNHSSIWHSRKHKPPSDSYLSFISPRLPARTPSYEINYLITRIFVPEAIPISNEEINENIIYCEAIEVLPV